MIQEKYGIVSVEPVDPPAGTAGTGWHRYVIEQGDNTICGYRRGKTRAVRLAVEEIVMRLNERQRGKVGRVHLTMTSPARKTSS